MAESSAEADDGNRKAKLRYEIIPRPRFIGADLDKQTVRAMLAAYHPMLESDYFIETSETDKFYNIVYDCVFARKSGLYITGGFRMGKTTAIHSSIKKLETDCPWAATFFHSAQRNIRPTQKSFCENLLHSMKYEAKLSKNPAHTLARHMMTEAGKRGCKTCVLFLDEAQMFNVLEMRYLLEIWNELRSEKFILVTILVGQEGLEHLKTLSDQTDQGAVVARFFVNRFSLGGLHSSSELKNYLTAYDQDLYYPENSPWAYSRYFCQKAFDEGWRLADEFERFWGALVEISAATERGIKMSGFRMAFINDSIHSFLLDAMRNDAKKFQGSIDHWRAAIHSAATSDLLIRQENA